MFYESVPEMLLKQIRTCFELENLKLNHKSKTQAKVVISPHAGYLYSGRVAAHSFSALAGESKRDTFVLIGPNHGRGNGHVVVSASSQWLTPLGSANINASFSNYLAENFDIISANEQQHSIEHSLEVQIPFLQYCFKDFNFVALLLNDQSIEVSTELAGILHKVSKDLKVNLQVIASSDFSHFVPKQVAEKKDIEAINYLLDFKTNEFYDYVLQNNVTACGVGPMVTACEFARLDGAKKSKLLKYSTSAQVTQDESNVVGYASIAFY